MKDNHRLASPRAENELLRGIWRRLQKETGINAGDSVNPDEYLTVSNPVQAGVKVGTTNVVYAMGITDHLSDEELTGVLAHELGHVDLDRRGIRGDSTQHEGYADAFAAKHGYGEALISALKTAQAFWGDSDDESDGVHEGNRTRIEFIRRNSLDTVTKGV